MLWLNIGLSVRPSVTVHCIGFKRHVDNSAVRKSSNRRQVSIYLTQACNRRCGSNHFCRPTNSRRLCNRRLQASSRIVVWKQIALLSQRGRALFRVCQWLP